MKRIFIGTRDIANNPSILRQGLETLGLDCTMGLRNKNPFYDSAIDNRLNVLFKQVRNRVTKTGELGDLQPLIAPYLDFDCYVFVTESLLPGMLDLPILRALGKEIIFCSTGTDARYSHAAKTFSDHFNNEFPESLLSDLLNDYDTQPRMALQDIYRDRYSNKLNTTRMPECYANSYLGSPRNLHFAIAPFFSSVAGADLSGCKAKIPNRVVPKILHCPSKRSFKQTNKIIDALDLLRDEGIQFEFEIAENLPHAEILKRLTDTDVLIDQLFPGKSALLGIEAMASGCVVVGCNTEAAMPFPLRIQPVVGVTQCNLEWRLRHVLSSRATRLELAEAGLAYTQLGLHEPHVIAKYCLDTLKRADTQDFDYYPTFFFEHCAPPSGEVVPEYLRKMSWEAAKSAGVAANFENISRYHSFHFPDYITAKDIAKLPRWDTAHKNSAIWGAWSTNTDFPHNVITSRDKSTANQLKALSIKYESESDL